MFENQKKGKYGNKKFLHKAPSKSRLNIEFTAC